MLDDIDIARSVAPRAIGEVAARLDIPPTALFPYGRHMAKIDGAWLKALPARQDAALILVTAVSPTPAGEGKTTTTIGLGDALNRIGKRTAICIREPSLGPCFGQKGGATGGGRAQVIPMETINLHFTGDFHAIGAANNLLAAMLDNHIYWGNALGIDPARVFWRRAIDMNDRSLRDIVTALGRDGLRAETGFDITVASEVMAVFCLAADLADLRSRLGRIVVAERADGSLITCADLKADGAMTALLKDAFSPNLVQTLEGNPVLIHGGPFGNIAHGCNSVVATRGALKLADYVVTEAGFGADLGAEKFFDIKCRQAGLMPRAAVVVATIRSLKMNGGLARSALARPDLTALERGCVNLGRHIENIRKFGVPPIVAINQFTHDSPTEIALIRAHGQALGVDVVLCRHWSEGGAGAEDLARGVVSLVESGTARFSPLYGDDLGLMDKIRAVASGVYRAGSVTAEPGVTEALARWEARGFRCLPVCIAKTQYSFTTDPKVLGAPEGHEIRIRGVRLSAGAGFVVALAGDIMTMPGLPRAPAAEGIGVDDEGEIYGLF